MLSHHLRLAIKDLEDLISITKNDMHDIKEAQHQPQFERIDYKEEKIKAFETKKAMIDHEISKLMTSNSQTPLQDLLTSEQHESLDLLKIRLAELREVNQKYAKMVLTVSSFYNSLLERVVPTQMEGYQSVASKESSILEVRA